MLLLVAVNGELRRELDYFLDQASCEKVLAEDTPIWGEGWTLTCEPVTSDYLSRDELIAIYKRVRGD